MFHAALSSRRGFTIVELLVVVAIIAILSAVAIASLVSSRAKGRDARRMADLNEVKNALDLYYDSYLTYPATGVGPAYALPTALQTSGYMARLPGTVQGIAYHYMAIDGSATPFTLCTVTPCSRYVLYVQFERNDNIKLTQDVDIVVTNGATVFDGSSVACTAVAGIPQPQPGGTELCFDQTP